MCGSGYLESASQVQFSGSCSQDFGPQGSNFQVLGTYFQGPGYQGPMSQSLSLRVPCPRVPESQNPNSQSPGSQSFKVLGLRVPGLRVPDLRVLGLRVLGTQSWVSGPDFRLCRFRNDKYYSSLFTHLLLVFLISIFDVKRHDSAYLSCANSPPFMEIDCVYW